MDITHIDIIKEKIKPILETDKFVKFMLYLLNDPHYGAINNAHNDNSIKALQEVIDLYEEWYNGEKPELIRWIEAKDNLAGSPTADWAAHAGYVLNESAFSIAYVAHNSVYAYGMNRSGAQSPPRRVGIVTLTI